MAVAKKKKKSTVKPKVDLTERYTSLGGLHTLLTEAFPTRKRKPYNVFDVQWLATRLGVTNKAIYYWFRVDSLPMKRAREIAAIRGCMIDLEQMLPFVS